MLEALAKAIDGTDEKETRQLAKEFNESFGDIVQASVGVESVQGEGERCVPEGSGRQKAMKPRTGEDKLEIISSGGDSEPVNLKKKKKDSLSSSESSDSEKSRKRKGKKRRVAKNKTNKVSKDDLNSSSSSDEFVSEANSSTNSSDAEDAELCYNVTDFESANLPDLPDKWDKGFRKLRSYVPLSLFRTSLIDSYYDEEADQKTKDKLDWSKTSLKLIERQLTYGDFIEMCDLEERYAREIHGLDTYADYIVKHKKIVSDLKKSYNCWMIGLRYHLKVRTVIFRRRKLIKSKFKGKTILKDEVKIPNGLQSTVEMQARHKADRAGDLQYVDNPYAPGGPKFGFNFLTGRASVASAASRVTEKTGDHRDLLNQATQRGKRGGTSVRPFVRRNNFPAFRGARLPYMEQQQEFRTPYQQAITYQPNRFYQQNRPVRAITGKSTNKAQVAEIQPR